MTEDGHTEIGVRLSSAEDLWNLYNMLQVGDNVRTKTKRKVVKESSIGTGSTESRVITLEVEVHAIDFDPLELRLQGINKRESEYVKMNAHHTLSIKSDPPQDVVFVKSEWDAVLDERLKDACDQEGKADTAAVAMDFGLANVCLVTSSLTYTKARIEVGIAKKHKANGSSRDASIRRFFQLVVDALAAHVDLEKVKVILICSPAHVREEFFDYMMEQAVKAETGFLRTVLLNREKFVLVKTTTGCKGAIREALLNSAVTSRMEATKSAADILAWQKFQKLMNDDPDRCVYTPQYVFEAHQLGAIENLLVSDSLFRTAVALERKFYLSLCQSVRELGGSVNIFSSNHVTGEQLALMSGIAATLRFPCPELDDIPVNPNFFGEEDAMDMIRTQSNSGSGMMTAA